MQKKFIELANGENYAYVEKGYGEKVLVLIHGNLSSSYYFKPLIQRLPEDLRVIAMDLRGFGDSTFNKPFTTLKELAEDVNMFIEALDIPKAIILGWSLGGGVAMEFAANYQEKCEKLILLSSTTHKGYPIFKKDENMKPIFTEVYKSPEEMAMDPLQVKPLIDAINDKNSAFISYIYDLTIYNVNKPPQADSEKYVTETIKQRCLEYADFALASLNMSNEPSLYSSGDGSINNIKVPVLHILGENDRTVLEYMVQDNINALQNSKYIKFANCGHSPLVDCPNELTEEIIKFI